MSPTVPGSPGNGSGDRDSAGEAGPVPGRDTALGGGAQPRRLQAVPDELAAESPVPEPADPGLAAVLAVLEEREKAAHLEVLGFWTGEHWRELVPDGVQPAAHEPEINAEYQRLLDTKFLAEAEVSAYIEENPGVVPMLRDSLRWHAAGWALLPIRADGSKAPTVDKWRQYHGAGARPGEEQVKDWFRNGHQGLAVMLGRVSRNRVMIEFEARGVTEGWRDRWMQLLHERGHGDLLDRYLGGLVIGSPSGGLNGFAEVQSDDPVGSQRWITRPRTPEEAEEWRCENGKDESVAVPGVVLAEVKGDRGYAVVWPSHGSVHKTGRPWRLLTGSPESCPVFTGDEFRILHDAAREISPVQEKPRKTRMAVREGRAVIRDWTPLEGAVVEARPGDRPGDHFNRVLGLDGYVEFMLAHGWGYSYCDEMREHYLIRPGKDFGTSATIGNPQHEGIYPKLHVFSTAAAPFEADHAYDAFGAYALLNHGGDISAAAGALAAQGYGWDSGRRPLRLGKLGERRAPADETEVFGALTRMISDQWLPGVYHRGGELVEAKPLPGGQIAVAPLTSDRLAALIARHTRPYLGGGSTPDGHHDGSGDD